MAYREQLVHELRGDLEGAALRAALGMLLERHDLLAAGVHHRGLAEPHWRVVEPGAVAVPYEVRDLTDCSTATAELQLWRFATADRRRGFDLERPPLWRCTHLQLPGRRHALVFTYHHMLLDGWSMPLLLRELSTCYAAACSGQ